MSRTKGIHQLLDTVGDGSGLKEANGNYSVAAGSFRLKHASGIADIYRMIVMIEDAGAFDSGLYGNGIVLTNGIRVYLKNSLNVVMEEFTGFPILTNGDWAGHCHDHEHHSFGSGNEVVSVRWTFDKSGQPLTVNFGAGEYLEVYLNDDFSGLVKHRFSVQGKYRKLGY